MVVNTYTQRERERETDRQPAKERLCEIEREKVKEVSSLVSGGSRRGHLKEILYPYIRSDGSDKKKKKSSIASPTPHICGVGKSVSINTFALGADGLQIGH